MKVLFMTNVPSPYRVDFFNELGKYCDLTVTFEKRISDERDKSWGNYKFENFNGIFLKGRSVSTDSAICPGVIRYVKDKSFEKIICTDFSSPTGMLAILYMRKHGIKYWLESDGGFAKSGRGFKEWVKRHFISGADGYFSTGAESDNYYITYGADPAKIRRYPFTSLRESDILNAILSKNEKDILRNALGMTEEKIVISVGQFIHRKGFDLLLQAASQLPGNIGFYFIGGTPTEEYCKLKRDLCLDNIHFIDYKAGDELKRYYQAADLFILPTREDIWGLVVNEAMANGLPVITTTRCIAGLELVKHGENGYLVSTENTVQELISRIRDIINDNDQLYLMSQNSLNIISNYTIEKMVQMHLHILNVDLLPKGF